MEAEKLYGQDAANFKLRLVLAPTATVDGRLVLELADTFVDRLVLPGCTVVSLWTKAPGMAAKPSIGEFSDRRWEAARKKIAANECAVLSLEARTDFPNQTIALYLQANPPGGSENIQTGTVEVTCSVPYLRHLAASREKTDALFDFGVRAWNGAKAVYGFGNLATTPKRTGGLGSFAMGGPPRLGPTPPPAEKVHDIPVAQTGTDIDGNIDVLIAKGRGIKGAYWANYLSAVHVQMAGGEPALRERLHGMRIERLNDDGVLIVATDSPLPEDSEENRRRFLRLAAALKPAFLSRAETPENKRALLGYFFRE